MQTFERYKTLVVSEVVGIPVPRTANVSSKNLTDYLSNFRQTETSTGDSKVRKNGGCLIINKCSHMLVLDKTCE